MALGLEPELLLELETCPLASRGGEKRKGHFGLRWGW